MKKKISYRFYLLLLLILLTGVGSSWYMYHLGKGASQETQEVSEVSPDQLTDTIKQKELLFVYFYTPDCVQCNKYEETFARAAAEAGLKWVKANVKYYPEFKDPYKIKSIPSLVAFKGGSEVSRLETDWDENKVNTFFQSIQ